MYILAKLVFVSYQPEELTQDMMFKNDQGKIYSIAWTRLTLKDIIEAYGYPVAPVIVSITANPDDKADIIATSNMIGWWDDGPQADELRDVTTDDFNRILEEDDGILEIEMDIFDEDHLVPVLYNDKVTIRLVTDDNESNDEYDEDYWNDTEWKYDHPKDKSDNDPE